MLVSNTDVELGILLTYYFFLFNYLEKKVEYTLKFSCYYKELLKMLLKNFM